MSHPALDLLPGALLRRVLPYLIGAAVLIGAILWLRADAYADGERAEEARWEEAGERFEEAADQAETEADRESAARAAAEFERVKQQKEKIDAATNEGSSPFDAIFGTDGVPGEAAPSGRPDPG